MSDFTARNIVNQLGDLYMEFTDPATSERAEFVKYRQDTNDLADRFVERLLLEHQADALDRAAEDLRRQIVEAGEAAELDVYGSPQRRVVDFLHYRATTLRGFAKRMETK